MRDDLIARLELAAASYERNAECGATTSSVQNEQFTAALFREAITALTAQGETAPADAQRCGRAFGTASTTAIAPFHCSRRAGHDGGCGWGEPYAAAASSLPAAEGLDRVVYNELLERLTHDIDCPVASQDSWGEPTISACTCGMMKAAGEAASAVLRAAAEGRR